MTVIDLGDVSAPPADSRPPAPARRSRRVAAGVALLCAVTLGAAAPAPEPPVRELWSTDAARGGGTALTADTLYLTRRTGGQPVLTAFELATGAVRWARPLPDGFGDGDPAPIRVADGMVRLPGSPRVVEFPAGEEPQGWFTYPGELAVLDAATGAQRWRMSGEIQASTRESALLADRDARGELRAMRLVDAHTGDILWDRALAHVREVLIQYAGDRPARIVTVGGTGEITVHRYADGAPVAHRPAPGHGTGQDTVATIAGEQLVVTSTDRLGATITAYRLDDPATRLWSIRTVRATLVTDCRPVLCLARGAEVAGLDPATGASRWLLPGKAGVDPVAPGRLLAYSDADPPREVLVDAATGRMIGDGGTGWPMPSDDSAGSRVLLRASRTDPARTVISRLDLDTGRVTDAGTVESTEGLDCDSTGRFLVCQRPGRTVVTAIG
ncbi:PQQ-binding-like beta-propeller repeat protein [Actinoplanes teichomyceticus]|uniref:Outer membrane protein assembly factor BamB n=1 Tax=Actinoplanes teichomyceticus TaxID=1867 RepID=A0A561WNY0_ACTTI|nr:PQQ-binding-like beta-propeller repeat protein [Actinoplanes teichomyceticus]TWG25560.1 outer membrane protein assembly factor BamB [Actinoplanes teichomyceticus]GIF10631.1 hypothetical protein Ate01nite_06630 [Actinoplanes teichomyceticus]